MTPLVALVIAAVLAVLVAVQFAVQGHLDPDHPRWHDRVGWACLCLGILLAGLAWDLRP
jgi:hypothetical protein